MRSMCATDVQAYLHIVQDRAVTGYPMIIYQWTLLLLYVGHFRGVQSILLLLFCLRWKILIGNSVDPDFAHDPFTGLQVRMG